MFCFSSHELRPFITVFLYSYFSTCCILGKNTIKILIFSVTLYCQSLCQIQTQKSEDRLCINDNTVIKYINIKITSAGCTDKLLCTFLIQFDLFLHSWPPAFLIFSYFSFTQKLSFCQYCLFHIKLFSTQCTISLSFLWKSCLIFLYYF